MEEKQEYIEICVGIGMDQITPEYIKIPVDPKPKNKTTKPNEIEIEREK